jgi:hypothetical protein
MDLLQGTLGLEQVLQHLGAKGNVKGLIPDGSRALGVTQDESCRRRIPSSLLEIAGIQVDPDGATRQMSCREAGPASDVDTGRVRAQAIDEANGLATPRAVEDGFEAAKRICGARPVVVLDAGAGRATTGEDDAGGLMGGRGVS